MMIYVILMGILIATAEMTYNMTGMSCI